METIVKSIPGINGSLYIVSGSNRYLLAECKVELQIVEESEKIPILGPVMLSKDVMRLSQLLMNTTA